MNAAVLLVGTQKGLFHLRSDRRQRGWIMEGPVIPGYEVTHAWLNPDDPAVGYAAANHPVWGAHIYRSEDGGYRWNSLGAVPCHRAGDYPTGLKAIWFLAPSRCGQRLSLYAGVDPPGIFRSDDGGESWLALEGLNRHPSRDTWEPSRGVFAVHSIYPDPRDAGRLYAAISAGGAFRSDDGGLSWQPINRGVRAPNLATSQPSTGHNIHRLVVHPLRPSRLYRQCYSGTYRSDDYGESWIEITSGLPSDFGYAIATAPSDPDTVYVIPEESQHLRTTAAGRLRVYRSRTAGAGWQPLTRGLPQEHVYVTVLREALAVDDGEPPGVYFGTSSGHLFASSDGGERWALLASYLPRVLCVNVTSDG